jgi:hypothetical protein
MNKSTADGKDTLHLESMCTAFRSNCSCWIVSIDILCLCCRDGSLRQRIRSERKERMTQQVREIKRKQQAAESWQQMKRSILQPLTIGIGVGVILLGGAIAYSYFTSRV